MTRSKHKTKLAGVEALVAGDRDLMKSLLREALQEVLEGEMTEFLPSQYHYARSAQLDVPLVYVQRGMSSGGCPAGDVQRGMSGPRSPGPLPGGKRPRHYPYSYGGRLA